MLAVFGFIFTSNSASAAWAIDANIVTVSYVTIASSSASTINVSGNWTTTAAFSAGSNNTVIFDAAAAQTITGATTWNNLTILNTGTPSDSLDVDPSAIQTVAGTLTVTDGQWTPYTGDDYTDVSIKAQGVMKPDASSTIYVSGDWENLGTFTHNSGEVNFDGAGGSTQTILGDTTFYYFTAETSTARTLKFTDGSTQTVSGTWTITGSSGQLITLMANALPAVGDSYAGGKVAFFNSSTDYMVAATSDQSTGTDWGCSGTTISGADGTAVGTGAQNTIDIVTDCTTAGIAAKICSDLDEGGYTDWWLPSKDELNILYTNRTAIGGFSDLNYWSSTEFSSTNAWKHFFSNGDQAATSKTNTIYYVRCVRGQ